MISQICTSTNYTFEQLTDVKFEEITKGRLGCILVGSSDRVPVIRTTTIYQNPPQLMADKYKDIVKSFGFQFNNAMVEIYSDDYKTMSYHSDQSLDLVEGSYIAIYSCYLDASNPNRKLVVKNKTTDMISEIILTNNSIVLFSTEFNTANLHKIVSFGKCLGNKWLGITYRLSATYSDQIRMANEEEKKEFFRFRSEENRSTSYKYPVINYTISPSDLMEVEK